MTVGREKIMLERSQNSTNEKCTGYKKQCGFRKKEIVVDVSFFEKMLKLFEKLHKQTRKTDFLRKKRSFDF